MASAGAAVAATSAVPKHANHVGLFTAAALMLPGVMPTAVHADTAPTEGVVALKVLSYKDWQSDLERIRVTSPSLYVLAPINGQWSVEGTLTHDNVSGASPRWHMNVSGASRMDDQRNAADVKLVRYFGRSAVGVRFAYSDEHDYRSNALSLDARLTSEDNNTTWNVGLGGAYDTINPVNELVVNERKRTAELIVGVTQNVTPVDVVQLNLSFGLGSGYYNDPYKLADKRPRVRNQGVVLARWNHHFETDGSTLRNSFRFYRDTFGINAQTVTVEWVKPLGERFSVTPSLRYHTQSAAKFYFDPVYDPIIGEPFPVGSPTHFSPDTRLSAFGALTVGVRLGWKFADTWAADVKFERYEQRANWRLGGGGSPGLSPFYAQFWQVGLSRAF
jgi:Protein of unknown function (DUF3570)